MIDTPNISYKNEDVVVIFSGGLDSTTVLYWAKKFFKNVYAITFDYGQRHKIELEMARKIASKVGVKEHKVFKVDLTQIGASALTDINIEVPKTESEKEIFERGIPITYVPFRNGIFLALAAAYAESKGITNVAGGWNQVDFSGYPDCRKEFLENFEKTLNAGTKIAVEGKPWTIYAPLLNLKKEDIIKLGISLGADYSYSISCYRGSEVPCLSCDSCVLRINAFKRLNLEDPLITRLKKEGKLT